MTIPDPKFRLEQIVLRNDIGPMVIHSRIWNERTWIYGVYVNNDYLKVVEKDLREIKLEEIR